MIKVCSKCKQELDISAFSSEKAPYCRACMKAYDNARKEKKKNYWKTYVETTDVLQRKREYYKNNTESEKARKSTPEAIALRKAYLKQNKEKILEQNRKYYSMNREKYSINAKKYREKHRAEINAQQKLYRIQNREQIIQRNKEPQRHLSNIISKGIYYSLKGTKTGLHWESLVSYNLQQLKEHLERQFDENMTWDNMGEYWEIDHIIPQNTFKFTTYQDKDFQICWSLMNLRPLYWLTNRQRPKDGSDISEELKQKILNQKI